MIESVLSERGRFNPLDPSHPGVGDICPGCGKPLEAGQRPALVNGVVDPEDQEKYDAGRSVNMACVMAHEECAFA